MAVDINDKIAEEDEHFKRKNVFYRSIQRLKRKKRPVPQEEKTVDKSQMQGLETKPPPKKDKEKEKPKSEKEKSCSKDSKQSKEKESKNQTKGKDNKEKGVKKEKGGKDCDTKFQDKEKIGKQQSKESDTSNPPAFPRSSSMTDSVISNSPSMTKLRLPGMQSSPNGPIIRSRDRSDSGRSKPSPTPINPVNKRIRERSDDSGRKGSAPPDLLKNEIGSAAKKETKSRPFSMFAAKKEEPVKPPSSPKPDHFRDVKLKKTVTEPKVVPKTTEKYKLFEGVYQVSLTAEVDETSGKIKIKPVVSWSHPPLGTTKCRNIAATEKIVPEFAFPDLDLLEKKRSKFLTETYAFVQTDMSAARTVGYCRRFKYKDTVASRLRSGTDASVTQSNENKNRKLTRNQRRLLKIRVWCIVTKLHCFDTFSMIFDEIHKMRRETTTNADSEVFSFLKSIGENAAPLPGYTTKIQYVSKSSADNEMGMYEVKRPGPEDRITLLKNANLLNKLSKSMLMTIMTAIFSESKLLFLDKSLSSLTSTLHALTSLLYPLQWVCIYIPMLSVGIRALVRDLVQSPSPYVIGMLKQDYTQVREHELKDTQVLVVDLTRKHLDDMRDDEAKKLPISESSRKALKHKLREVKKKDDPTELSEIWRDFLKPYLNMIDELCFEAPKVDGIRRIPMASCVDKIKEVQPGDEVFAEKLFSTQMSQLWLQKQRLAVSRY